MKKKLPNFICVGAQKSATTTLADMLRNHPEVFVPEQKELHFFDNDNYLNSHINEYLNHFRDSRNCLIRTDFTPSYLYFTEVPQRILNTLGKEIKILIMLRNPIGRAISHYRMTYNRGYENLTFKESFYKEKERISVNSFSRSHFSYFDRGLYYKQVERYLELFPNIKVVTFDTFIKDSYSVMDEIYQFLNVKKVKIPLEKSNESKSPKFVQINNLMNKITTIASKVSFIKKSELLKSVRSKVIDMNASNDKLDVVIDDDFYNVLHEYYYGDISNLEKLVGIDLSGWKIFHNKYR